MSNRRDFIRYSGAAVAAASVPMIYEVLAADHAQLPTRPIPGSNESLAIVGLGNTNVFASGDIELSRRLLDVFMDRGGAYIDTTGSSRFTVAQIVKEEDLQDRTFVGTYVADTDDQAVREDISAVLAAQGDDTLDLVLTRNVNDYATRRDDFRQLQEDGLTRYIGVARHQERYHQPMMDLMAAGAVDFVQVNYSLLETEADERLLPMAQDEGVAIITNRPFINGRWFSIVKGKPLPDWAADFDCNSWAQFSVKFILSHPAVNCVLTETSNPEHAIDNIGGGIGRMPDQETRQRMLQLVRSFL